MAITKNVNEWEELERRREDLRKWIKDREAQLVEFRSKPYRLRADVARVDANKLQELRTQLDEKKTELDDIEARQRSLAPSIEDDLIKEQLIQLETQVGAHWSSSNRTECHYLTSDSFDYIFLSWWSYQLIELIESHNKIKQQVEEYRNLIGRLQAWYENLVRRAEALERGDGMDSRQKIERIKVSCWKSKLLQVKLFYCAMQE